MGHGEDGVGQAVTCANPQVVRDGSATAPNSRELSAIAVRDLSRRCEMRQRPWSNSDSHFQKIVSIRQGLAKYSRFGDGIAKRRVTAVGQPRWAKWLPEGAEG